MKIYLIDLYSDMKEHFERVLNTELTLSRHRSRNSETYLGLYTYELSEEEVMIIKLKWPHYNFIEAPSNEL